MQVRTPDDDLQTYLTDASNLSGGHAEKLFLPESQHEIGEILAEASDKQTPVTISGSRTGTVGGAIPFGGIVISLEKLNRIIKIDRAEQIAVIEPGVILADLQRAVDAEGLLYPPDPTEWSCQIGGTVATNASGARSFKYGSTREFVNRLKIILSDGDTLEIVRGKHLSDETGSIYLETDSGRKINVKAPSYDRPDVRKNVSGYFNSRPLDAIDLFIGSEGTLGVIAEIELRLVKKPAGFFSGIVFFENENDLLAFVDEAKALSFSTRSGSVDSSPSSDSPDASLIEYFDSNALKFISDRFPETPEGMAGAIFFEQETNERNEDGLLAAWNALLEKYGADLDRSWFTTNEQDLEKMREFRHALPVSVNERISKYKQRKVGTDMAVPDVNFASFLRFYKSALDSSGLDHVIFGHIGDCHLHANMLPKNEDEATAARYLYGRCVAQAIMLGGTVSAEHGIGKLKRKYLSAMMGERYLNEMAGIKGALDPKRILGLGNIFDVGYLR